MELEPTTATGAAAVVATLLGVLVRRGWKRFARWLLAELALFVLAGTERGRRRDRRERAPRRGKPGEVPVWIDPQDETTDVFKLVELEREHRSRRESEQMPLPPPAPRVRGGTRAPRRGTHHDGED